MNRRGPSPEPHGTPWKWGAVGEVLLLLLNQIFNTKFPSVVAVRSTWANSSVWRLEGDEEIKHTVHAFWTSQCTCNQTAVSDAQCERLKEACDQKFNCFSYTCWKPPSEVAESQLFHWSCSVANSRNPGSSQVWMSGTVEGGKKKLSFSIDILHWHSWVFAVFEH